MRVSKWVILLFYLFLFTSFGYLSYSEFLTGGNFGFLLGICSFLVLLELYSLVGKKRKEGMKKKLVIADKRIIEQIKLSLSVCFIYILLYLVIALFGLYNAYFNSAITIMEAAVITSLWSFFSCNFCKEFLDHKIFVVFFV